MVTSDMSVMPRVANAAITSGWARIASSTSWYSSVVKCGVTPGTWVHEATASPVRSTTASQVWLSSRFQSTASALRGTGSPGRQALTSLLGGSTPSMDANRHASDRDLSRRRTAAVWRNSASSSGSSGCCAIGFSSVDVTVGQKRLGGVPGCPLRLVSPFPGDGRQGLEDDAVRQGRSDVSVVVGRADLDHVHAHDRELEADAAYGVEELARRQAARLGRAGARSVSWVADVDGEEDAVAVVH